MYSAALLIRLEHLEVHTGAEMRFGLVAAQDSDSRKYTFRYEIEKKKLQRRRTVF